MRRYLTTASLAAALLLAASPGFAGWEEGVAALKAGNYDTAAKEFKALADAQPEVFEYQLMLGQTYLALNRPADAITHLRKAYDLDPSGTSIKFQLAQAYDKADRHQDGLKLLQTIDVGSLSKSDQQKYYLLRSRALSATGNSDALLQDLRAVARNSPNDASAQFNLGQACYSARDLECAIPALEAAVRLDANDPSKNQTLLKAYLLHGRLSQGSTKRSAYSKAAGVAQKLVAASASYDNLLYLCEAQLGAKDYAATARTCDQAAKAESSAWLPLYYKAQAQTNIGQLDSAESALKSALGKTTSSTSQKQIWSQLGFIYEKQKSYEEAIAAYRQIGNTKAVSRVEENRRIAMENLEVEEYNRQIEELEKERERLEEEMSDLPPDLR